MMGFERVCFVRRRRRTLDALAAEVASGEPGRMVSDPRRPMPGTKLVREWNGVEHSAPSWPRALNGRAAGTNRFPARRGRSPARTGTAGSSSASHHARGSANDPPNTAATAPPLGAAPSTPASRARKGSTWNSTGSTRSGSPRLPSGGRVVRRALHRLPDQADRRRNRRVCPRDGPATFSTGQVRLS